MKMSLFLSLCTLLLCLNSIAQKNKPDNRIARMKWLVGSWQGSFSGGPFYEAWRILNDTTLINFTIEVTKTDTIVKENGSFRIIDKDVYFVGNDARWKLNELNDSSITLANDTLKYANRIVWSHSKGDHWLTYIKNPRNEIRYDLIKVKWLDKHIDAYVSKQSGKKRK